MGGYDPYSSSKGCADLLVNSYRNSYFNTKDYKKTHNTLIASCRAGNVIGGGDWSPYRIVPDIVNATENKETLFVRSPESTRPWQHVLEPLSGYLLIGQKLLNGESKYADAWNFGPKDDAIVTVKELVDSAKKYWDSLAVELNNEELKQHEAKLLKLDISKAIYELKWKPVWSFEDTVEHTFTWYRDLSGVSDQDHKAYQERTLSDIKAFINQSMD
jgi:CDP-glucose 4,6-dehydratase